MGLIYGKKANANGSKKLETTGNLSSLCECANGKGSSDTTVLTYNRHFRSLGYHLDMTMTFDELTKEALDSMLVSLRKSGVSPNTISSYARRM